MNKDLRYYGNPMNWESTKGDLISREALKKSLNFVYDCAYIDSKSKEGIVSDIIDEIDNAPIVPLPDFKEGYKQAILDKLCKTARRVGQVGNIRNTLPELFRVFSNRLLFNGRAK